MPEKPELQELIKRVAEFDGWNHAEKIRFFAWFLHAHEKKDRFNSGDINDCFSALHVQPPSNIGPFLSAMEKKNPKDLMKDGRGYSMVKGVRDAYQSKYGQREITVQIAKMLEDLPAKVPDLAEQEFLKEALTCLRNHAFRAAIVMTWNLAYFHLIQHVLKHKLAEFNAQYPITYKDKHAKAKMKTLATYDDFSIDLKESEVLQICKSATIINNDVYKILDRSLGRRNSAAHPSSVTVSHLQTEDTISDLVQNVILTLPL
jgi:hypothetical protein